MRALLPALAVLSLFTSRVALADEPIVALAHEPEAEAPVERTVDPDRTAVIAQGQVDVRAMLRTTPLLQYMGVGASADVGVWELGPGTLSAGGSLAYDACGTTCSGTPFGFTQRQLVPEGRVAYHLAPPKIGRLDLYPLVTVGVVLSRSSIRVGDSDYRASNMAPTVGMGGGATYFFADRFFVAGEARFRFGGGTYDYELASGPAQRFDRAGVETWSVNGVDLGLAVGARF